MGNGSQRRERDVVERDELDAVSDARRLELGPHEDVPAGFAALGAFRAQQGRHRAQVGDDARGWVAAAEGAVLEGALGGAGGLGEAGALEVGDGSLGGLRVGEEEPFGCGEGFAHWWGGSFGFEVAPASVHVYDAGEGGGRRVG